MRRLQLGDRDPSLILPLPYAADQAAKDVPELLLQQQFRDILSAEARARSLLKLPRQVARGGAP